MLDPRGPDYINDCHCVHRFCRDAAVGCVVPVPPKNRNKDHKDQKGRGGDRGGSGREKMVHSTGCVLVAAGIAWVLGSSWLR